MFHFIYLISLFFYQADNKPIQVYSLEQLQKRVNHNDTLYVVNFWATWCKPCVEELPDFDQASIHFQNKPVKIILASLDFLKDSLRVQSFIERKKIYSEAILFSAGNPNSWIDMIDASWQGSIPATVMYKNSQKHFFKEGSMNFSELEQQIIKNLN